MRKCEVPFQPDGKVRPIVNAVNDSDKDIYVVDIMLQFEKEESNETIVAVMELDTKKRDDDEWWLCAIRLNGTEWSRNEPLKDW